MTKNERLKSERIKSGLSQEELAELLVVTQAYIGNLESEKSFSLKKATEIAKHINSDGQYIYFGNEENSNKNVLNDPTNTTPTANKENKGVPYFDVDFVGGFDLVFNSHQVNPSFYIDFLPFNDADYWVNVTGKSMAPLIAHGDIIALKEVKDWRRFLLEGEIYAILTDNGFRTVKIIGKGPDTDHLMLIPYNKSDDYQPQPIPKEVITHVFRVKGAIKKFF